MSGCRHHGGKDGGARTRTSDYQARGRDDREGSAAQRYIESGDYTADSHYRPGANYVEKEINHHTALRNGLLAEVRIRAAGARPPALPDGLDLVGLTRSWPGTGGSASSPAALLSALRTGASVRFNRPPSAKAECSR